MAYGITHGPNSGRPRWTPRPDNTTPEQHAAFLIECASKHPAVEGVSKLSEAKTKKDKISFLRHMLATNIAWATKGAWQIHKLQTASEAENGSTTDANSVGWSGYDAKGMTWIANWINKQNERGVSFAEAVNKPKAIRKLHKIMPKYASQLLRIVEGKVKVSK